MTLWEGDVAVIGGGSAGCAAAAMAAERGAVPGELDATSLRDRLRADGAII